MDAHDLKPRSLTRGLPASAREEDVRGSSGAFLPIDMIYVSLLEEGASVRKMVVPCRCVSKNFVA